MSKVSSPSKSSLAVMATLAAVPLAIGVAGCGSGSSNASAGGTASAAMSGKPAVGTATPTPKVTVPKYVAADNARKAVTDSSCAHKGKKGWLVSGTVTNSASSKRNYSIVIDFVTPKGDTVMDTKIVHVSSVATKSSAKWSVLGAAGQPKILCVIRQALASS